MGSHFRPFEGELSRFGLATASHPAKILNNRLRRGNPPFEEFHTSFRRPLGSRAIAGRHLPETHQSCCSLREGPPATWLDEGPGRSRSPELPVRGSRSRRLLSCTNHFAQGIILISFRVQSIRPPVALLPRSPNLQKHPHLQGAKLGHAVRAVFLPAEEDYVLMSADYSQIELRILASRVHEGTLVNAFRSGADVHSPTAAQSLWGHSRPGGREMRTK